VRIERAVEWIDARAAKGPAKKKGGRRKSVKGKGK
jgi:hypothetical protein